MSKRWYGPTRDPEMLAVAALFDRIRSTQAELLGMARFSLLGRRRISHIETRFDPARLPL